jgi:hypothetical protein
MGQNQKTNNDINHVRATVESIMGFDIFTRNRKRGAVEARMVFSSVLRKMGYTFKEIGTILRKDHSTVIHYINKAEDLEFSDKTFYKKHLKCKELLCFEQETIPLSNQLPLGVQLNNLRQTVSELEKKVEELIALTAKKTNQDE